MIVAQCVMTRTERLGQPWQPYTPILLPKQVVMVGLPIMRVPGGTTSAGEAGRHLIFYDKGAEERAWSELQGKTTILPQIPNGHPQLTLVDPQTWPLGTVVEMPDRTLDQLIGYRHLLQHGRQLVVLVFRHP